MPSYQSTAELNNTNRRRATSTVTVSAKRSLLLLSVVTDDSAMAARGTLPVFRYLCSYLSHFIFLVKFGIWLLHSVF